MCVWGGPGETQPSPTNERNGGVLGCARVLAVVSLATVCFVSGSCVYMYVGVYGGCCERGGASMHRC